ncbi:MAG TPA: PilZ domain-containing protein [Pyrinomonadaceae bacterium]|nr:PilZ domain-containing protein [Pyrinomonadaceae bacterium]
MFDVLNEMSDDFDSTWDLSQEERRREERSRLTIDIYFDGTDANGIASTRDIGPSGLYLNTKAVLPEGARLALRIPFGNRQFLVDATVVYSNPGRGVGLRFERLSQETGEAIEQIVNAALV